MDKKHVFNVRKLIIGLTIAFGVLLIAGAVVLAVAQADFTDKQTAADVVSAMDAIIPARRKAVPESHYGENMPSSEIRGEDFVGLLEIDAYGIRLPVASDWQYADKERFPALYSGSVYDRNAIIGGSNGKEQFSFIDEIDIGTEIRFIDLYGREFQYEVSMVNHADALKSIESGEEHLTLFAPSAMTSKYVIVRCRLQGM